MSDDSLRNASMPIYILGGAQTDFARNFTREGLGLFDLIREAVQAGLADAALSPGEVQVGHIGNFVAELLNRQSHLGGLLIEAEPGFRDLPVMRHEAACASGSMAVLSAMADLQAGRYDVACVLGVEMMRAQKGFDAQRMLEVAAWVPRETAGADYPWVNLLSQVGDEYERRHGLRAEHLYALSRNNFDNARKNPRAQTRTWEFGPRAFTADEVENPLVSGRLRKQECSQVTDGGVALFLASPRAAKVHAGRLGKSLSALPRIVGWGHRTARMALSDKLADSRLGPYLFPHVQRTIAEALRRAGLVDAFGLSALECHDCFSTMEYMILDHLGLAPPGHPERLIEEGVFWPGGRLPVNPSGGLMGVGHPVGATGVRMLLDAARQVSDQAGECQVPGARRVATVNIGGSATTCACFVVEAS
jgi:acetyl-CoA C-acetyltransferase